VSEASDMRAATAEPMRPRLVVQAVRAWSLPTSVVPAAAGGLVAIGDGRASWWLLPIALLALLLLHAGVNVANDVEDAARDADPPDKDRNSGLFNTGRVTIATGRRLYGGCFAAAALLGFGICAVQGPALLVIGWAGLLGGLLYTAGPLPYKYLGLGEAAIVLLMGPLITLGTFTAVTGRAFAAAGFWVGLGPGLLIAGVLAANNLTDLVLDTAAGARTVAVRIGFRRPRAVPGTARRDPPGAGGALGERAVRAVDPAAAARRTGTRRVRAIGALGTPGRRPGAAAAHALHRPGASVVQPAARRRGRTGPRDLVGARSL
jgi:1,4-dihydroxy-2-naphthoate octaprenyltransferase